MIKYDEVHELSRDKSESLLEIMKSYMYDISIDSPDTEDMFLIRDEFLSRKLRGFAFHDKLALGAISFNTGNKVLYIRYAKDLVQQHTHDFLIYTDSIAIEIDKDTAMQKAVGWSLANTSDGWHSNRDDRHTDTINKYMELFGEFVSELGIELKQDKSTLILADKHTNMKFTEWMDSYLYPLIQDITDLIDV